MPGGRDLHRLLVAVVAAGVAARRRLVCCDVSDEWTSIARRYWAEAGVADRADLRIAPAIETLDALLAEGLPVTFDLAFIDADKSGYRAYYERGLASSARAA